MWLSSWLDFFVSVVTLW